MASTRSGSRWPNLMRETTAREYLDGVSSAYFRSMIAPRLATVNLSGEIRYTKASIDEWIEDGSRSDGMPTRAEVARLLDEDEDNELERPSHRGRRGRG